jgi:hypothetical protein
MYIGMFAVSPARGGAAPADFDWFEYRAGDKAQTDRTALIRSGYRLERGSPMFPIRSVL